MKSEEYEHRIGRTGCAGRDGLAVTLAEFRDQRKIQGIEAYTRQPLQTEVIPGLEPTQRLQPARKPQDRRGGGKGRSEHRGGGGWGGGWGQDRQPQGRGDGFKSRGEGFARKSEGFSGEGFQRREDGFQRRDDGFNRRADAGGRHGEGFGQKPDGFKRKGEGAPRHADGAGRAPGKGAERRGPMQIRSNGKPAGGARVAFKPRAR